MAATTTEMTTGTTPIEIILKDATSARQNTIEVLPDVTFTELLDSAKDAWSLPDGYEYIIRVARLGRQVVLSHTIQAIGIRDHDVLEIQAQGVAGASTLASVRRTPSTFRTGSSLRPACKRGPRTARGRGSCTRARKNKRRRQWTDQADGP